MQLRPNPVEGRWRWWYAALADWMIANPGAYIKDACLRNGGPIDAAPNTLSMIANTDLFKSYLEDRRRRNIECHDHSILSKQMAIAEISLDIVLETLTKKRTAVPFAQVAEMSASTLSRLGYGPKSAPAVQINNNTQTNVAITPVSQAALAEARDAMRAAEQLRAQQQRLLEPPRPEPTTIEALLEGEDDLNISPE